jgi:hypothetical protein
MQGEQESAYRVRGCREIDLAIRCNICPRLLEAYQAVGSIVYANSMRTTMLSLICDELVTERIKSIKRNGLDGAMR